MSKSSRGHARWRCLRSLRAVAEAAAAPEIRHRRERTFAWLDVLHVMRLRQRERVGVRRAVRLRRSRARCISYALATDPATRFNSLNLAYLREQVLYGN